MSLEWDLPRSPHPHHGGQCDQLVQLLDQCEVRDRGMGTLSKLRQRCSSLVSSTWVKGLEGWRTGDRQAGAGLGCPWRREQGALRLS